MLCDNISRWGKAFSVDISTMLTIRNRSIFGPTALITSFRLTQIAETLFKCFEKKQQVHVTFIY